MVSGSMTMCCEATLAPFSGRRCLVTGGLGFIGSNLALALHHAGAEVTVVDALVPRHGGNPRNLGDAPIDVIVADLSDVTAVGDVAAHAEYVFNLAGQVSHIDSMEDPLGDLDLNVRSHLAFLELLRRRNPGAVVVYSSTRQIYGRPRYLPVDEEHPVNPVDVNGICKYAAEQFHLLYGARYGLRVTSVRLSNVYGPRQRLLGDHQGFVPIFVRRALEGEPITLYGDGSQERDCLFVDDAIEALAVAALTPEAVGEAFNVGGRDRLTVWRIAEMIVEAAGSGSVESVPWPPDRQRIDVGSFATDHSKAKRVLGWEPATGFADGIRATIEFYRAHLEWYL
jgi:UDP-glucose 4-epimerase